MNTDPKEETALCSLLCIRQNFNHRSGGLLGSFQGLCFALDTRVGCRKKPRTVSGRESVQADVQPSLLQTSVR